jgi:hypothetical protein
MEINFKKVPIDNMSHVLVDSNTSDPIAIVSKPGSSWEKNQVSCKWHPDFLKMNPIVADSILHRNLGMFKNGPGASNEIHNRYMSVLNDKIDPVMKTTFQGVQEFDNNSAENGKEKREVFHVYDADGVHFATIHGRIGMNDIIGTSHDRGYDVTSVIRHVPISDTVKAAAKQSHSGTTFESHLRRQKYMSDRRSKEPRFIGDQTGKSLAKTFKTKLDPEAASSEYEAEMKKQRPEHTFIRHSPTMFSFSKEAGTRYDTEQSEDHIVKTSPGYVTHITSQMNKPGYEYKTPNAQIIEETEYGNVNKV